MLLSSIIAILIPCFVVTIHAQKSVLLYSEVGQLVTSSTLVWQPFIPGDPKPFDNAVLIGNITIDEKRKPLYVCRSIIEGVFVTGHTETETERTICIVSMHMEVHRQHTFEILINKANSAKLKWKDWSKFSARIPRGAVSATSAGHVSIFVFFNLI